MEVFPASQFDIEARYRSICEQLPQDLETKLNTAFDITDGVMDITKKPESYTPQDKQKLEAAIKANFELHEDLFTWYINTQANNVSNIKELFTVSVQNQDYGKLVISDQTLNLTVSLDIKGNFNESAPINLTTDQLQNLKELLTTIFTPCDQSIFGLGGEDTEKAKAKIQENFPQEQAEQIFRNAAAVVQIYAKKIQEAVDPEKLAIIEEYNRFHLQYYKNKEGRWAERPIAIVAGIGDTGSGKETFYKKFTKYGLIPAITGTGGLTKDHEGFYQVYEQTMQGLKIVADNAGFINPMQAMSPIMLVALRRKMDQRGLQNVPMHLDGVIRSVEQAEGITKDIPKDKLRFYNLRINERVGFERLIIRLVSKYLNEQDLRKDDLADLLVDKNTGNSYTPKGFSQFVQTQVELLQKMASKEAKSMQDKRRVERAKKIQEQKTNPVALGKFIAERFRTLNQGYLNPAGRFIKYNKNEFPKIANNLREAGFEIPVIYGDRLTIEETHDAMIATLGKDCFPKEALMDIAYRRRKEPVYMAYLEDRNTIIKLANNREADMALDYAIQFARKKYLALREAFATKSEKRNGVYYEHKEGAFSAIDNKVVFSEVQNSTSTVLCLEDPIMVLTN